jgi:hypothetical protein
LGGVLIAQRPGGDGGIGVAGDLDGRLVGERAGPVDGVVDRVRRRRQGFLGWAQPDVASLAQRDHPAYRRLLEVAYATAADPAILGMAAHLLFIGERR